MSKRDIDELTGLPECPDGHFWYISTENNGWWRENIIVSLNKINYPASEYTRKRKFAHFFGKPAWSSLVEDFPFNYSSEDSNEDIKQRIVAACDAILAQQDSYIKLQEIDSFVKTLFGSYPPKKLEN